MRVRAAADGSRTRGGVPRRAGGTCIAPAVEAAAVRAGGARAVRGAGPGARLGRACRGRRVATPPAPRPRPRGPAAHHEIPWLAPGGACPRACPPRLELVAVVAGGAAGARGVAAPRPRSGVGRGSGLPVPGRSAAGARRARPPPGRPPALQGRRAAAVLGPPPGGRHVCSFISSLCRKSRIFQGLPLGKPGENWYDHGCPGRHGRGPPAGVGTTTPGAYGTCH